LDRPERIKIRRKLEFIVERLKERTLLVLDNLEGMAQDEKGILKSDWRGLIDALLSENIFFIILTSRLKPFYDERKGFDNILEIGEYTKAEVGFLRQRLIKGKFKKEAEYLDKKSPQIKRYFGLHPLSIAKAIELRYEDLMILIKIEEFKKYLDFYRNYFKRFKEDTKYLFSLPYSFSQAFMEKILSPDFIAYMKNRLLAFKKINGHFYPYKVIRTYFLKEFKLDLDTLKRFKDKLLTIIGTKGFTPEDALNALNIFLYYYEATKDKGIEKEIVETFNRYHPEDRVIDPSLLDALSKTLKEFKTVDSFKLALAKRTLGELYASVGKGEAIDSLKGAIDDYDKALEQNPKLAKAYNNRANAKRTLGKLYASVGKGEEAIKSFNSAYLDLKELLYIYKESQGFWGMLEIYPRLIDLGVKAKNRDYQEMAEYIEDFLGLFEALAPEGRKRGIMHFFVKEKTLDNLDLSVIKAYIKAPISKKRLDEFIEMYEIVKDLMEKEV